jgi:hypothetical protein
MDSPLKYFAELRDPPVDRTREHLIESERYHNATGKIESEIRYYFTSLKPEAERLNRAIRQRWGIENKLQSPRCQPWLPRTFIFLMMFCHFD